MAIPRINRGFLAATGMSAMLLASSAITPARAEDTPEEQRSAQVEPAENGPTLAFATSSNNAATSGNETARARTAPQTQEEREHAAEEARIERVINSDEGYVFVRVPAPRNETEARQGVDVRALNAGIYEDGTPTGRIVVTSYVFETHSDLRDEDIPTEWREAVLASRDQQRFLNIVLPRLDAESEARIIHFEAVAGYFDENGELHEHYMRGLEGDLSASPTYNFNPETMRPQAYARLDAPYLVDREGEQQYLAFVRGMDISWIATEGADNKAKANAVAGDLRHVIRTTNRQMQEANFVVNTNKENNGPLADARDHEPG